jgi:hypothetical protein
MHQNINLQCTHIYAYSNSPCEEVYTICIFMFKLQYTPYNMQIFEKYVNSFVTSSTKLNKSCTTKHNKHTSLESDLAIWQDLAKRKSLILACLWQVVVVQQDGEVEGGEVVEVILLVLLFSLLLLLIVVFLIVVFLLLLLILLLHLLHQTMKRLLHWPTLMILQLHEHGRDT